MIKQFTLEELAHLRDAYQGAPVLMLPADPLLAALLNSCEDAALKQLAEAGIRTLSLSAIVACWGRGVRIFARQKPC